MGWNSQPSRRSAESGASPFFAIESLRMDFGGIRAIDDLSLGLGDGEMLCIIGPNGCGKTTLFNLITGTFQPTAGHIFFCGTDITGLAPYEVSRAGIGRKFQVPGIYPEHTVFENIQVALFGKVGPTGFAALFRKNLAETEIRRAIAEVGLEAKLQAPAGSLSHGEKQWLEIGMVLASRPKLMLLDEPTAGMTFSETEATARLIKRISAETGTSLIIIEHDISFIRQLDCPIVVMLKGTPVCRGSYEEIRNNALVRTAYLGTHG